MKKYLIFLILLSGCAPQDYEQLRAIVIQNAKKHNALIDRLYSEKILSKEAEKK